MSFVTKSFAPFRSRATFFLVSHLLPCTRSSPSFHVLYQIQLQVGFGFPNPIPACLDIISMCLLSYLFLPHVCCLLCLNLVKSNLFFSAGLLQETKLPLLGFPAQYDGLLLNLEEVILDKNLPDLPDTSSLQGHIPWDSSKQDPEQAQVFSPEIQSYGPAICLAPSSQDSPSHSHHSQSCPWPVPPQPVLQSISPHCLLHHLHQDITMNELQKPPALLVCSAALSLQQIDVGVAKACHEN